MFFQHKPSEVKTPVIISEVVGGSTLAGDNQYDAFLWDGKMHDLGALNGCSYAFAINAHRQVVGNWGSNGCQQGAFLWEGGGPMVDLNTLVSSNKSGLSVAGAININDRGEIAGSSADVNGYSFAILLIPCDENHPGVEGCDYSMVDANTAKQSPTPRYVPSGMQPSSQSRRMKRYHIPSQPAR
jgi:probable HAF family extracellular repeat protein